MCCDHAPNANMNEVVKYGAMKIQNAATALMDAAYINTARAVSVPKTYCTAAPYLFFSITYKGSSTSEPNINRIQNPTNAKGLSL